VERQGDVRLRDGWIQTNRLIRGRSRFGLGLATANESVEAHHGE
jgi:hypothetical protein